MEQEKVLAGLILVIFLLQGTGAQSKQANHLIKVDDSRGDGSVHLTCDFRDKTIWLKDGSVISLPNATKNTLNLGNSAKDPRGMYQCRGGSKGNSKLLQVYYRMCENCIKLNVGTISGFIFAEIISIFFLAVGIYFIAGQDGVRQSRASDKQTLLQNEQLYQPLKDREDDQYSHLQGNQLRKK